MKRNISGQQASNAINFEDKFDFKSRLLLSLLLLLLFNTIYFYSMSNFFAPYIYVLILLILSVSLLMPLDVSLTLSNLIEFYDTNIVEIEKKFDSLRKNLGSHEDLYYQIYVSYNKFIALDLILLFLLWIGFDGFLAKNVFGINLGDLWIYSKLLLVTLIMGHLIYNLALPSFEGVNSLKYFGYYDKIENSKLPFLLLSFALSFLMHSLFEIYWDSVKNLVWEDSLFLTSDVLFLLILTSLVLLSINLLIFRGFALAASASKRPLYVIHAYVLVVSILSVTSVNFIVNLINGDLAIALMLISSVSFLILLLFAMKVISNVTGSLGLFVASTHPERRGRLISTRYRSATEMEGSLKIALFFELIVLILIFLSSYLQIAWSPPVIFYISYLLGQMLLIALVSAYVGLSHLFSNISNDLIREENRYKETLKALRRRKRRDKKISQKVVKEQPTKIDVGDYSKMLEEFESIFEETEEDEI